MRVKIQVSQDDLAELSQTAQPEVETSATDENNSEDVSLDEVSESENQAADITSDDTEASNS